MKKIFKKINWRVVNVIIYIALALSFGRYVGIKEGCETGFVLGKFVGATAIFQLHEKWIDNPDTNWQEFFKATREYLLKDNFNECYDSLMAEADE